METDLATTIRQLAEAARAASLKLAVATTEAKNRALTTLAEKIESSIPSLIAANANDLEAGRAAGLSSAMLDRLTLNESRIRQMAQGVREIVVLPDPVGTELERTTRPNGLVIRKIRVPIGVIGIIYESRPNVTVDCAALCLKAGNATILRGGKEAFHSNTALAAIIAEALAVAGLPATAVQLIPTTDRAALNTLLKLNDLVHCIIPRGGETLIRFVTENSTIPVIKHYKGVCFVYVDRAADLAIAEPLLINAKVQRPSACNAAEQLLVHRDIAPTALPRLAKALQSSRNGGVELRCDAVSAAILAAAGLATKPATAEDYRTEFLDYVLCVRVVDSLDSAIATINRDSSNHSDAIVTADESAARRFQGEVDSATVYWNASTRFTDGFEFGLGAEIGISTDRLHARGPMGLAELCSYKFVIDGTGQIRR
jgi:glutamate-5-semialdehyde dehydrogenase